MTDTPMTPDREQEIRVAVANFSTHPELGFACCSAHAAADAVPELLAEVDRLRARVAELEGAPDETPQCGKTESTSGGVYAPCDRPAGHLEAYCRATPHTHYFLAADTGKEGQR